MPVTLARMSTGTGRTTNVGGVITLLAGFLATALVAGLLGAGLLMPAVGAVGASARAGVHAFDSLPAELKVTPLAQQSTILAADGSVIATFYDENRIVVPLAKIAPVMQTAIVAIEDDRFYKHGGIDPHGILRALVNNSQGAGTQGASTLTQQFVKLTLVENCLADNDLKCAQAATDRSGTSGYARKLQELKYAVSIEKTMDKKQILQGYLNIAYFGSGTYGVESAALHYFGIHASQLNLPQAAMLAGLVQAPSTYDPYTNMAAAVARRNTVLGRMLTLKDITQPQHDTAVASKIVLRKGTTGNDCSSSRVPLLLRLRPPHPQHQRGHRRRRPAAGWADGAHDAAAQGAGRRAEDDQLGHPPGQLQPDRLGRHDHPAGHRQDHLDGAGLALADGRSRWRRPRRRITG